MKKGSLNKVIKITLIIALIIGGLSIAYYAVPTEEPDQAITVPAEEPDQAITVPEEPVDSEISPEEADKEEIKSIDDFVFWKGNYHSHGAYDGEGGEKYGGRGVRGVSEETNYIYNYANAVSYMDFTGVTSHIQIKNTGELGKGSLWYEKTYQDIRKAAVSYTELHPDFVALTGYEWTSWTPLPDGAQHHGHVVVFDDDQLPIDHGDGVFQSTEPPVIYPGHDIYEYIAGKKDPNILIQLAHPSPKITGEEENWTSFGRLDMENIWPEIDERIACLSVFTGGGHDDRTDFSDKTMDRSEAYEYYLDLGWHIGAIADQDNVQENWGAATSARTGVVAAAGTPLNKKAILDAYRLHRTYATQDMNSKLMFTANGWWMGQKIGGSSDIQFEIFYENPSETVWNNNTGYSITEKADDYITEIAIFGSRNGFSEPLWSRSDLKNSAGHITVKIDDATEGEWFVIRVKDSSTLCSSPPYISPVATISCPLYDTTYSSPVWYEPDNPDSLPVFGAEETMVTIDTPMDEPAIPATPVEPAEPAPTATEETTTEGDKAEEEKILAPTKIPSSIQSISQSECGDGQGCYKVKVDCEGLASREAEIRVNSNKDSKGTVFFLGGGYGQSWYGDGAEAASLISGMKEKGFETYEIKWLGKKGWGTDNAGQGLKKLSCGNAEIIRWVVENYANNPDVVGATGHSGGANEIAYQLVVHGMENILDVAVMSGGPGRADLVELCCVSPPDSTKNLVNYAMGWEGNGDYCKTGCDPEWTVPALQAESLVNSSPEELRDYHYPDTQVVFIEGGRDKYAAQGKLLYDVITSEKSWEVVPNVGHGITNNSDGVALIQKKLLEGLEGE